MNREVVSYLERVEAGHRPTREEALLLASETDIPRLMATAAFLRDQAHRNIITFSKNSRPHQDILNLLHAGSVSAPRINCVNSIAAMTRLVRDGFGIGALPPALVHDELKQGLLTILDEVPEPPKEPYVKPGELYHLGDHRILCGDATDPAAVARLLDGAAPALLATDPP